MANDIVNASAGDTTGTSRIGKAVINSGGRGSLSYDVMDPAQPRVKDTTISDVAAKFDARFDDPRYYSGDTAS